MPTHHHEHHHHHNHQHQHHQEHQQHSFTRLDNPEFDWSAAADWLQLDGQIITPLVQTLCDELCTERLDADAVSQVMDVGCGPGVISCELARRFPAATVVAIDSAPPLLQRVHDRAWSEGLSRRVVTVPTDIDVDIPLKGSADLAWVSMVIHHVADIGAALERIRLALRPGGWIVVTEFAGDPVAFVDNDPIVQAGTWQRLEQASVAERRERLGFDFIGHDWAAELSAAGFSTVSDDIRVFTQTAPLDDTHRDWLVRHMRRGLELADAHLSDEDTTALTLLADQIERGERTDAFLTSERRVLIAQRPA